MKNKAAQELARLGRGISSVAKARAARRNGKLGGRPTTRPDFKAQVLAYAKEQLVLWKKKFGHYHEFYEIVAAIERAQ